MTIDPLLLARLRGRGMDDIRIRHLHDTVENGSKEMRDAAIHLLSAVADGPVRHYTRDEGLTAELALGHGIHWTGRALRLSASRSIPATTLAALPGGPLSKVADFPGAERHVVTGFEVDASGNTWIAADAAKDQPPARGGAFERLAARLDLVRDDWRRNDTRIAAQGGSGAALAAGVILAVFLPVVWALLLGAPWVGVPAGLCLLAVAAFTFILPAPEEWGDARRDHMRDMQALQAAQGW